MASDGLQPLEELRDVPPRVPSGAQEGSPEPQEVPLELSEPEEALLEPQDVTPNPQWVPPGAQEIPPELQEVSSRTLGSSSRTPILEELLQLLLLTLSLPSAG